MILIEAALWLYGTIPTPRGHQLPAHEVGTQASWEGTSVPFWELVFKAFVSSRQANYTELARAFPTIFFEKLGTYKGEQMSFYLDIGIIQIYLKTRNTSFL